MKPAKRPRPVVRVVIECYPREASRATLRCYRDDLREIMWGDDYRRPRVVSVKAVKGKARSMCFSCDRRPVKYADMLCESCHRVAVRGAKR